MQLPYKVHCVRTQVVHQPGLFDDGTDALNLMSGKTDGEAEGDTEAGDGDASATARRSKTPFRFDEDLFLSDGTDTDMLLIDFH